MVGGGHGTSEGEEEETGVHTNPQCANKSSELKTKVPFAATQDAAESAAESSAPVDKRGPG